MMKRDTVERLRPDVGADDHSQGPSDAPVTLVIYGDYECPYTRRANDAVRETQQQLGDQLRLVYRHFPLTEIHPHAQRAAEAAEGAARQDRFWEMHDHLFAHQRALEEDDLSRYAAELGLDRRRFDQDRVGSDLGARIERDVASGLESGVQGTPALFVNGTRHAGSYETGALVEALTAAMRG